MIQPPTTSPVGIVGSDSSTSALTVDILNDARRRSVNGKMVLVAPQDEDGAHEYALGTVTSIVTRNRFHEDPAIRGVAALRGGIGNLTNRGDIKTATVDVQAAFRASLDGETINPLGGSLSFAPDTGEAVHVATAEVITSIAQAVTRDLFYLGNMYRQPDIPLPLHIPDFSGSRGSSFGAFFGPSGSGKTATATIAAASMMRHQAMSFLLIDPQMQFSTSAKVTRELPVDLRALAEAQGREVRQLSIVTDIQMTPNPRMFIDLLDNASYLSATSGLGASTKVQEVRDLLMDYLTEQTASKQGDDDGKEVENWFERDADALLADVCQHLIDNATSVMSTESARDNFIDRLTTALNARGHSNPDKAGPWRTKVKTFASFHAMFNPNRPDGTPKASIDDVVKKLCGSGRGAVGKGAFYILALGAPVGSKPSDDGAKDVAQAMRSTANQMVVLRTLFSAVEKESRRLYQRSDSEPANLLIFLDEAARYTSDSSRAAPEARQMADDMARYMREIRKYAVGFWMILQEPSVMHESIWKQLLNGFRAFAGGLVGSDLDKVREQIAGSGAMNLYQQLAQPSATNPVYPWMLCGSVSPINATNNPLFMEAFTAQKWAAANHDWLPGTFNTADVWAGRWG